MTRNAEEVQFVYELTYPEIEGFERTSVHVKANGTTHSGYVTKKAKKCPYCGGMPIFEQFVLDYEVVQDPTARRGRKPVRRMPAETFVALCPDCYLRNEGEGPLEFVLKQWNDRKFSPDSEMLQKPLEDPDQEGMMELMRRSMEDEVNDAVQAVKHRHYLLKRLKNKNLSFKRREELYIDLRMVNADLRNIEKWIREKPIFAMYDAEAILSEIRKRVYPKLTPEERTEKPLQLDRL